MTYYSVMWCYKDAGLTAICVLVLTANLPDDVYLCANTLINTDMVILLLLVYVHGHHMCVTDDDVIMILPIKSLRSGILITCVYLNRNVPRIEGWHTEMMCVCPSYWLADYMLQWDVLALFCTDDLAIEICVPYLDRELHGRCYCCVYMLLLILLNVYLYVSLG